MKGLIAAAGVLLALVATTTACLAAGPDGSGAGQPEARGTLWAFPPGLEFVNATDGGCTSAEVGLLPALWSSGDGIGTDTGGRVGLFLYPGGGARGAALYTGFTLEVLELGVWYVWRSPRGGASFRIGAGWLQSYGAVSGGVPGFGAAIGLTF
jgi:hypothetical protein